MIDLTAYNAQAGWNDLGATKTGIQVINNNTEEVFDVDQILADIDSRPSGWTMNVATQLAEVTLARLQLAWEGGTITDDGVTSAMGLGAPTFYTRRRLAVLYQRPNGKIRAFVFRRVQRTPQESSLDYNKTGPQQAIPMRFNCMADVSIVDLYFQFGVIFDQD
jgi:hypothetical protein